MADNIARIVNIIAYLWLGYVLQDLRITVRDIKKQLDNDETKEV